MNTESEAALGTATTFTHLFKRAVSAVTLQTSCATVTRCSDLTVTYDTDTLGTVTFPLPSVPSLLAHVHTRCFLIV